MCLPKAPSVIMKIRTSIILLIALVTAVLSTGCGPATKLETEAHPICIVGDNLAAWTQTVPSGDSTDDNVSDDPQEPVSASDLKSDHSNGSFSELRANVRRRKIRAHNTNYFSTTQPEALNRIHEYSFSFRLPFLPPDGTQKSNYALNGHGETIEGGLFVFDGPGTKRDFGAAFQWNINREGENFGRVAFWEVDAAGNGSWQYDKRKTSILTVDTKWHTVQFRINIPTKTTEMFIDGVAFPCAFANAQIKGGDFANETRIQLRLQAEIVSKGPKVNPMHVAQFKDWRWCPLIP